MKNLTYFLIFFLFVKSLNALTLEDTVKSTIKNNSKVKIALEKLEQSKEIITYAAGYKLPKITGTVAGTYINSDKTISDNTKSTPETLTDLYKISVEKNEC